MFAVHQLGIFALLGAHSHARLRRTKASRVARAWNHSTYHPSPLAQPPAPSLTRWRGRSVVELGVWVFHGLDAFARCVGTPGRDDPRPAAGVPTLYAELYTDLADMDHTYMYDRGLVARVAHAQWPSWSIFGTPWLAPGTCLLYRPRPTWSFGHPLDECNKSLEQISHLHHNNIHWGARSHPHEHGNGGPGKLKVLSLCAIRCRCGVVQNSPSASVVPILLRPHFLLVVRVVSKEAV